ncbi:MAG: carbohydrate kinase family protein, partial [Promethearchaeota archaeon]
ETSNKENHVDTVAIIGDLNIDIITPPFQMPEDESSCILEDFTMSLGGNAINVAAALASLGQTHKFYGALGDDAISLWIEQKLKELKINYNLSRLKNKTAGITFALTYLKGRRQFIATLGTNKYLAEEHINLKEISKYKHLHRAGFWYTPKLIGSPTIRFLKSVISEGGQTSLDVGWDPDDFPEEHREVLYDTLEYTEVFFANEKEMRYITGKKDLKSAIDEVLQITTHVDKPILVVHQGAKGSLIATRSDQIKIKTNKVPQNNPTGTGDLYNAGFIYGVLHGWKLNKCGVFADAVACVHLRDRTKIYPNLNDINAFLNEFYRKDIRSLV